MGVGCASRPITMAALPSAASGPEIRRGGFIVACLLAAEPLSEAELELLQDPVRRPCLSDPAGPKGGAP